MIFRTLSATTGDALRSAQHLPLAFMFRAFGAGLDLALGFSAHSLSA